MAFARTETPSRGVPALVHTPVVGSATAHMGTLMPWTVFTVSCSAVSMSDEKICAISGSYESAPSWLQLVPAGVPFAPAKVSTHSSGLVVAPCCVCQCLCSTSISPMNRSSRCRATPVVGFLAVANAETRGVMAL